MYSPRALHRLPLLLLLRHRRRDSHSLSDPKLFFLRKELDDLHSLHPLTAPQPPPPPPPPPPLKPKTEVEISHPWPEWAELVERLIKNGYLDLSTAAAMDGGGKTSNLIRTACLNFARHRVDLIRYFSRRDIHMMVRAGCPSLDRKVVNSGKRLRAHVGINEGDVCSACSLRGNCERAYVKAREDEGGRTVDIMRFLLTYGLDLTSESVESQAPQCKLIKESVRKLMKEMVEFSVKEFDFTTSKVTSGQPPSRFDNKSNRCQMPKPQTNVLMKQGDWICPKCNFLNFAKNIKCLRCDGVFQEKLDRLREEREHLPLKKGDWICEKCNFLNFAKNTKCLQCNEKPTMRQLNPGEWECVSCNYINFRKNMVCLKCDWKRPKSLSSTIVGNASESYQDNSRLYQKHSGISFVRNSSDPSSHQFVQQKLSLEEDDTSLWSSEEDETNEDKDDNRFVDDFPVVGGKSVISRDPSMQERWKQEMSRNRVISTKEKDDVKRRGHSIPFETELDEASSGDDIAGWFR